MSMNLNLMEEQSDYKRCKGKKSWINSHGAFTIEFF